jgi:hypothetical protein
MIANMNMVGRLSLTDRKEESEKMPLSPLPPKRDSTITISGPIEAKPTKAQQKIGSADHPPMTLYCITTAADSCFNLIFCFCGTSLESAS